MVTENPDSCSCSSLRQATRHVSRLYDAALAALNLSLNQYSILAKLDRFGPQSVQSLSDILVMDRSTLGHLLGPLQRHGWVEVVVAESDRRRRTIRLTPDGEEHFRLAKLRWAAAEQAFEAAFGTEDAEALRRLMRRVTLTELLAV